MDGANTVQNETRISSTLTDTQELWRWENLKEKEHRCIFYKDSPFSKNIEVVEENCHNPQQKIDSLVKYSPVREMGGRRQRKARRARSERVLHRWVQVLCGVLCCTSLLRGQRPAPDIANLTIV